ncbi:MAG: bis(5'-nucleosyl)-tetraphosphatase (symmetrical) YqeK [Phytoplasma sp.]|uniref:bis(5'-nucleosyl)-tetraphosphatase (symmetrical) YqeK n=1 Tax=Phytoplasma sp. TaxID=2155 RepID=UPI002B410C8F|nr:bis(5'-nucleosyl)-tetraphosphatase (symmetrical) YqeK [Phytoplasma sp.]WRH06762.1 MAG: bis(5'-nucleosyl)-tetraphosphatase (symmetrical) YqeK [Phytoplasma sp.]
MNILIEIILTKIKEKFDNDNKRLNHILGVHRKAIELSRLYKVDIEKTQIASLLHDYTKNESLDFHLSVLDKKNIDKYKLAPFFYHALSTAVVIQKEFDIKNRQILSAIKKHVWGSIKMNKLDKIIFISDKIEHNRTYENVNYLRKLSLENLDKTIYFFLKFTFLYYKEKKFRIFPEQLEIFKFFKNKIE